MDDKDIPARADYDERAKQFWTLYVNEAEQDDKYLTETWKSDMDSTLIFAGLFSAAVTAFLIDSYKLLQVDSSDVTNNLLEQLLAVQIVGASLNTSAIPIPTVVPTSSFKPSASAITINILWFLSLSCSLAAALCAALVQQWTRDYLQRIHRSSQPQRRGTIRGIMFYGSVKWRMNDVVDNIPSLLHLSLFSFFAGLCIFLFTIDNVTAGVVLVIVTGCLAFYVFCTFVPVWDQSAPYETPFSSLLWRIQQCFAAALGTVKQRDKLAKAREALDLAKAREVLASPSYNLSIHEHIQAVSWLCDRTTDDSELEKLVAAIPGFLDTDDGRKAWKVFFTNTPDIAKEVEGRIYRLLCTSSMHNYLDSKSQKLRATLCIDAMLAMLSVHQFNDTTPTFDPEFDFHPIRSSWKDDDALVTLSLCLEASLDSRSLIGRLQSVDDRMSRFCDLSAKADQTMRDLDDMQHILDSFLQDYSDGSCESHKADIMILAKAFFDVAESKALVLRHWAELIQDTGIYVYRYDFLTWYFGLAFELRSFQPDYCVPSLPGDQSLPLTALQALGYLRLHKVFPPLPEISYTLKNENERGLSETWVATDDVCPTRDESGSPARETGIHMPIVHHQINGGIWKYPSREFYPLSSLLGIGGVSFLTTPVKMSPIQQHRSCNWMLLATRDEGPFSLLASLYEAFVEDKGTIGGLLMLVMTLRRYETQVFNSSIVDKGLRVICSYLSDSSLSYLFEPISTGSQFLLVVALLEILAWKRDTPFEVCFPFSDDTIRHLVSMLYYRLDKDLPITMAERGLGITPHSGSSNRDRVRSIYDLMDKLFREANVTPWNI